MMFVAAECTPTSFKDFTLIMPAISVGNVGQLAVDLIVSTLNMCRVGYIHTDCLIPMAGNNPYATLAENANDLSTNAEVYSSPELRLAVLQIRTPIVQTKSKKFCKLMVSWIKASGFSRTVVLSSSHAYQRDDQQLLGTPLRYLQTPSMQKVTGDRLKEMDWKEMETISTFPGVTDSEQRLYIPGGGATKGLFTDSCAEDIPLHVVSVLSLCSSCAEDIPLHVVSVLSLCSSCAEDIPLHVVSVLSLCSSCAEDIPLHVVSVFQLC
ncbi:proteasome assembly chaperone 2 isoform X1 [Salvelinus fontinalis]|uniref:proteasome assembly chaperone 2 isoform X1 n=1 Tax=Salvelinus fontinalis TaxID=8038 RepID=UPI0024853FFA|nr:proteasome assembly chaperone 2 isoform X1 [Salvelinus fontinalis]